MSFNRRNPFNLTPATSQSTHWQQLPPRQLSTSEWAESQSHSPQQQQVQPDRPDHLWSVLRPTNRSMGVHPSTSRSPFFRSGHSLSITAADELLFFGGYAHYSLHNDLYVFSMRNRCLTFLQTSGEVPSPRSLLVSVLVSNVLLIFGGATNMDNDGVLIGPFSDSLYLLSLGTLNFFDVKTDSS
jgi:hypothetical protein